MPETTLPARTPMRRRLQAVWLTYHTRPMMRGAAVIVGFLGAFFLFFVIATWFEGSTPNRSTRMTIGMAPGMGLLACLAALAIHAKSQFVTPNARLLPGYRPAHSGVLRGASLLMLVGVPWMAAVSINLAPLGAVALSLLLGAGVVWTFHTPRAAFLVMAVFLSLYHPDVLAFWLDPHPSRWVFHTPLLALGGLAVWGWLRRLEKLHEERPDYALAVLATGIARPSRSERAELRKFAAKQHGGNASWNDWSTDGLLSRSGLSCYELLRLTLIPGPAWFRGLFGSLLFCGPSAAMAVWLNPSSAYGTGVYFVMPIVMTLFMPGVITSQAIDLKRPQLETEMLRPVSRRDYLAAFFRALLGEAAIMGGITAAVTLMVVALITPDLITGWRLACFLAALPICNLVFVATHLWMAPRHSGLSRIVAQTTLLLVVGPLATLCLVSPDLLESESLSLALAVATGAIFLVAGVGMLRSAYGRWLAMEVA